MTRPRLHGLGTLLIGASPLLLGLFCFGLLPSASWEARFFGGNALLFAGLLLIALSQTLRSAGPGDGDGAVEDAGPDVSGPVVHHHARSTGDGR
ncbi:hypothetical protein ACLGIH_17150 [Streptomyces sp. HMX87]|uniref:hypothetical protein n=1 Tax=Streptomyces sp. HMX87 TaxID=3390849 RepID=UPI003A8B96D4